MKDYRFSVEGALDIFLIGLFVFMSFFSAFFIFNFNGADLLKFLYTLNDKLQKMNEIKNYLFSLGIFVIMPLIYSLGSFVYFVADGLIDIFYKFRSEEYVLKALILEKSGYDMEKVNFNLQCYLKIEDFLHAKEDNPWIKESWKYYRYSLLFMSLAVALFFGVYFFFPIIDGIYILEKYNVRLSMFSSLLYLLNLIVAFVVFFTLAVLTARGFKFNLSKIAYWLRFTFSVVIFISLLGVILCLFAPNVEISIESILWCVLGFASFIAIALPSMVIIIKLLESLRFLFFLIFCFVINFILGVEEILYLNQADKLFEKFKSSEVPFCEVLCLNNKVLKVIGLKLNLISSAYLFIISSLIILLLMAALQSRDKANFFLLLGSKANRLTDKKTGAEG